MVVAAGCKCCWARRGDQVGSLGDEVEGGSFSQVLVLGSNSLVPLTEDLEGRARRSASGGPGEDVLGSLGVVGQGPGGGWPSSERRKGG